MTQPILIKKYPNRRLYNTEKSAYITLEQVADLIKEGRTIKVVDVKTDEDVTAFILNQIILEKSRSGTMLPVSLLHLIIRYGDNVLRDFFDQYLEETLNLYVNSKMAFDNQFRRWLQMGGFGKVDTGIDSGKNPFSEIFKFYTADPESREKDDDETDNTDKNDNRG